MYKLFSIPELKQGIGLPENYTIDGFFAFWSYDDGKFKSRIIEALDSLKIKAIKENIEHLFFANIDCYLIEGRRFWFWLYYWGATLSEHCHIASICWSKKNILVGSCGWLQPWEKSESILIPTYSHWFESSALMYSWGEHNHVADEKLSDKLCNAIKNNWYVPLRYPIITCQGMLAETWEHVVDWSSKWFGWVEMESSTLFSVSRHFNVPAAAILRIADNLIEQETVFDESYQSDERKKIKESVRKIMFQEAIRELIQL